MLFQRSSAFLIHNKCISKDDLSSTEIAFIVSSNEKKKSIEDKS